MLKPEQSPLILGIKDISHGFFNRLGGVSPAPFNSLNFSLRVGDEPKLVRENRKRALVALGLEGSTLMIPNIVHGTRAVLLQENDTAQEILNTEADALISQSSTHVLGVTYADCLPIMVASKDASVVAIIHAGWRGLLHGIIAETIKKIHHHCGAKKLVAAIGPGISSRGFDFGGDGLKQFRKGWPQFISHDHTVSFVDLSGVAQAQLSRLGVMVEKVGGFTDLEPAHYFSHRRDSGQTGRHLAIIAKK